MASNKWKINPISNKGEGRKRDNLKEIEIV
jgi:hypothetical protein